MIEIATVLIVLHGVGGSEVLINPAMVTSMHAAKPNEPNKLFTDAVACMISLSDGKFVTVVEPCDTVKQMMEQAR